MECVYLFLSNTAVVRLLNAALVEAGYQAVAVEVLPVGILTVAPLADGKTWDYQGRIEHDATQGQYIIVGRVEGMEARGWTKKPPSASRRKWADRSGEV